MVIYGKVMGKLKKNNKANFLLATRYIGKKRGNLEWEKEGEEEGQEEEEEDKYDERSSN